MLTKRDKSAAINPLVKKEQPTYNNNNCTEGKWERAVLVVSLAYSVQTGALVKYYY